MPKNLQLSPHSVNESSEWSDEADLQGRKEPTSMATLRRLNPCKGDERWQKTIQFKNANGSLNFILE